MFVINGKSNKIIQIKALSLSAAIILGGMTSVVLSQLKLISIGGAL